MSTEWTERIMGLLVASEGQVINRLISQCDDGSAETDRDDPVLDFASAAAKLKDGGFDIDRQAAHERAWLALPVRMGSMNRPFGRQRQEEFTRRAGYIYMGLFLKALGDRVYSRLEDGSLNDGADRTQRALLLAVTSLLEAPEIQSYARK